MTLDEVFSARCRELLREALEPVVEALDELRRELAGHRTPAAASPYLSCAQAAEHVGVKRTTIHGWIRKGLLPEYVFGGVHRIRLADLEALAASDAPDNREVDVDVDADAIAATILRMNEPRT